MTSENLLVLGILAVSVVLFVSNKLRVDVVATLRPAVMSVARETDIPRSKLLIPVGLGIADGRQHDHYRHAGQQAHAADRLIEVVIVPGLGYVARP